MFQCPLCPPETVKVHRGKQKQNEKKITRQPSHRVGVMVTLETRLVDRYVQGIHEPVKVTEVQIVKEAKVCLKCAKMLAKEAANFDAASVYGDSQQVA